MDGGHRTLIITKGGVDKDRAKPCFKPQLRVVLSAAGTNTHTQSEHRRAFRIGKSYPNPKPVSSMVSACNYTWLERKTWVNQSEASFQRGSIQGNPKGVPLSVHVPALSIRGPAQRSTRTVLPARLLKRTFVCSPSFVKCELTRPNFLEEDFLFFLLPLHI